MPGFSEQCEEVQFPKAGIESITLKLLHKVSVGVFVGVHHRLHDPPRWRIFLHFRELPKTEVTPLHRMSGSKEFHRLSRFITLLKFSRVFCAPIR
jgi:hypothetical protein